METVAVKDKGEKDQGSLWSSDTCEGKEGSLGQRPPSLQGSSETVVAWLMQAPEQSLPIRECTSDRSLDRVPFCAQSLAGSSPDSVQPWHKYHGRSVGTTAGGCLLTTLLAADSLEGRPEWCNPLATKEDKLRRVRWSKHWSNSSETGIGVRNN